MRIEVESVSKTPFGDNTWLKDLDTGIVYAHFSGTGVVARSDGAKPTEEETFAVLQAIQTYSKPKKQPWQLGSWMWGWTEVGPAKWKWDTDTWSSGWQIPCNDQ